MCEMIKAEDLRIGDLVRYGEDVITIHAIYDKDVNSFVIEKEGICIDCDELEPITLTTKILTNNGCGARQIGLHEFLIYNEDSDMYLKWSDIDNRYTYNDFLRSKNFITVRYVHELQHILWALGKDANLTI